MSERDLIEELQAISEDRHGAKNTHLLSWLEKGYFHCQHGSEEWCQGDYLDSARAYIERLEAVSKASLATIARLSEALAEAEKKGVEARAKALEDAIEAIRAAAVTTTLSGDDAASFCNGADWMEGEAIKAIRDLSQGGQHG